MSIFGSIKREIEKLAGDIKHDIDKVGGEVKKNIEHDAELAGHAISHAAEHAEETVTDAANHEITKIKGAANDIAQTVKGNLIAEIVSTGIKEAAKLLDKYGDDIVGLSVSLGGVSFTVDEPTQHLDRIRHAIAHPPRSEREVGALIEAFAPDSVTLSFGGERVGAVCTGRKSGGRGVHHDQLGPVSRRADRINSWARHIKYPRLSLSGLSGMRVIEPPPTRTAEDIPLSA